MRKALLLLILFSLNAVAAPREESCGRYRLVGKLAPEGVVLFADTPNERVVRVSGLDVHARSRADYAVTVRVRKKFVDAPDEAELLAREGVNHSIVDLKRGFKLLSVEKCD